MLIFYSIHISLVGEEIGRIWRPFSWLSFCHLHVPDIYTNVYQSPNAFNMYVVPSIFLSKYYIQVITICHVMSCDYHACMRNKAKVTYKFG